MNNPSPNRDKASPHEALWRALFVLALGSYPFLIYFGVQQFSPRVLAFMLLMLLGLRLIFNGRRDTTMVWPTIAAALLCVAVLWFNHDALLQWYPVVMSGGFLLLFATSLVFGPPVIERIARALDGELSARDVRYTRRLTQLWCVFFIVNGTLAALTTMASKQWWLLYNGMISYVLMGSFLVIERIGRERFKQWVKA